MLFMALVRINSILFILHDLMTVCRFSTSRQIDDGGAGVATSTLREAAAKDI